MKERFTTKCQTCEKVHSLTGDTKDAPFIMWRVDCSCGAVLYPEYKTPGGRAHDKTRSLHRAILDIFSEVEKPVTVRQMFYLLATRHVIAKDDPGYNRTQATLTDMRRNGSIPYRWLADSTREGLQAPTYGSLSAALDEMHRYYRRDLWAEQTAYVEVWLEKRTLTSALSPVTSDYGVKLYPMGGYPSLSQLYGAAQELMRVAEAGKTVHIYHVGDLDADGAYISTVIERELRQHAGFDFHFERLALCPEHLDRYALHSATRPQKRTSKRLAWWFDHYGKDQAACELEAMHPDALRSLVRNAIERHIDPYSWNRLKLIEREERETLGVVSANLADLSSQWASLEVTP